MVVKSALSAVFISDVLTFGGIAAIDQGLWNMDAK